MKLLQKKENPLNSVNKIKNNYSESKIFLIKKYYKILIFLFKKIFIYNIIFILLNIKFNLNF